MGQISSQPLPGGGQHPWAMQAHAVAHSPWALLPAPALSNSQLGLWQNSFSCHPSLAPSTSTNTACTSSLAIKGARYQKTRKIRRNSQKCLERKERRHCLCEPPALPSVPLCLHAAPEQASKQALLRFSTQNSQFWKKTKPGMGRPEGHSRNSSCWAGSS